MDMTHFLPTQWVLGIPQNLGHVSGCRAVSPPHTDHWAARFTPPRLECPRNIPARPWMGGPASSYKRCQRGPFLIKRSCSFQKIQAGEDTNIMLDSMTHTSWCVTFCSPELWPLTHHLCPRASLQAALCWQTPSSLLSWRKPPAQQISKGRLNVQPKAGHARLPAPVIQPLPWGGSARSWETRGWWHDACCLPCFLPSATYSCLISW